MDPLVAAVTAAIEELLKRGVRIQPEADGWLIQLADAVETQDDTPVASVSRSW